MKINKQNYVDEAERVIIGLKEADRNGRLALTTSKIRNILSMCRSCIRIHSTAVKISWMQI